MYDLVIYLRKIYRLGGVRTATLNLIKSLYRHGKKVLLVYKDLYDIESIYDFAKYADTKSIGSMKKLACNKCLIASNYPIPPQIDAKFFMQWIHSDYEKYNLKLQNKDIVDKYIGVSDYVSQKSESMFGVVCDTIYNVTSDDIKLPEKRVLKLVTNSRISPEKGFTRMGLLAKKFIENDIPFHWTVCGNNETNERLGDTIKNVVNAITENIDFVGYKEDITLRLLGADYLVQLSDWEGCPYSVLEALQLKVPVIVTNYPGADELVESGRNGYIVPMDMRGINAKQIYEDIPKIKTNFKIGAEKWLKILKS